MKKKVFWTKRAEKSYQAIVEYIVGEWGIDVANTFSQKLFNIIDLLSLFPEMGTLEYKKIRGFPIAKKISLFYKVLSDRIIILHLFNHKQDPEERHKNL